MWPTCHLVATAPPPGSEKMVVARPTLLLARDAVADRRETLAKAAATVARNLRKTANGPTYLAAHAARPVKPVENRCGASILGRRLHTAGDRQGGSNVRQDSDRAARA